MPFHFMKKKSISNRLCQMNDFTVYYQNDSFINVCLSLLILAN